jgi:integrase
VSVRLIRLGKRKAWQARVAFRGLRSSAVRATKAEAREAEAALLQELRRRAGDWTAAGRVPATMRALFEAYTQDLENRGKSEDTVARASQTATVIERLVPDLLTKSVSALSEADIFRFRQAREAQGCKPSTINRDLRTLCAMLRKARPDFRFPRSAFYPEDDTRVRWLSEEQEDRLFISLPSPIREIAQLAALTLMRRGELLRLRREHVDLDQGVILLPRAKTGPRPVILSEAARAIVAAQLGKHDRPWVFPNADGAPYSGVHVSRVFRHATRRLGLRDFHFHDLRHHGATRALNSGFTAPIVMQLGGWKTERMMRRYAAVTDATLRRAAEAVSGKGSFHLSTGAQATAPAERRRPVAKTGRP